MSIKKSEIVVILFVIAICTVVFFWLKQIDKNLINQINATNIQLNTYRAIYDCDSFFGKGMEIDVVNSSVNYYTENPAKKFKELDQYLKTGKCYLKRRHGDDKFAVVVPVKVGIDEVDSCIEFYMKRWKLTSFIDREQPFIDKVTIYKEEVDIVGKEGRIYLFKIIADWYIPL